MVPSFNLTPLYIGLIQFSYFVTDFCHGYTKFTSNMDNAWEPGLDDTGVYDEDIYYESFASHGKCSSGGVIKPIEIKCKR